jgi:hypothetical protein
VLETKGILGQALDTVLDIALGVQDGTVKELTGEIQGQLREVVEVREIEPPQ